MTPIQFDRRALLTCSAAGGAALLGLLGSVADSAAGQTSAPSGRSRRIVSAHRADGKSYIATDETADPGGLWATKPDQLLGPAPPDEPRVLTRVTGETRAFVATIQPSRDPKPNLENRIGFHRTPGIAYCYILSGELVYLVDTQEVKVRAGDLVVERNTLHSWRNETGSPVPMLVVVVNASA
jgi:hypothetical protein